MENDAPITVSNSNVAVLDIGSNSIKILIATRGPAGGVLPLLNRSIDARISAGISAAEPRLSDEGMRRGCAAVEELLALARPYEPARIALVATSAVRDAVNGPDFRAQVLTRTGHAIRILSGEEEANGIGRGLVSDPALAALRDFHVFDLGGGSLECLAFRGRRISHSLSLQLGCVRLMEKFVADPAAPFPDESRRAIAAHTRTALLASGLPLDRTDAAAVATGGTVATVRAIVGARTGRSVAETEPRITAAQLAELLAQLAPLTLAQRRQVPGLPAARADVFPVALVTFLAVAETGGFAEFRHSFHNLRYGLAAELLDTL